MQRSPVSSNPALFCRLVYALILGSLPLACAGNGCENTLRNLTDPYAFDGLVHRGATVAHVHNRRQGYGSGRTLELYAHLKPLGVNSIQLNTFAYQPRNDSTTLRWDDPTLTFEDLAEEIRTAREQGLRVLIKPHVWVGGWQGGAPEQWRSKIRFTDDAPADAWFASYAEFLLPQARIAEREGVSAFVVGTELVGLTHPRHNRRWRGLIEQVRKVYGGELSYACEAWNAKNIQFWDALDAIGVDFYYGYPPPEASDQPPLEYAQAGAGAEPAAPRLTPNGVAGLAQFYRTKLDHHFAQARSLRRPLWLTEIGFPSHELAIRAPHAGPIPNWRWRPNSRHRPIAPCIWRCGQTQPARPMLPAIRRVCGSGNTRPRWTAMRAATTPAVFMCAASPPRRSCARSFRTRTEPRAASGNSNRRSEGIQVPGTRSRT